MKNITRRMKEDSTLMAALDISVRNEILKKVKESLLDKSDDIFAANKKDLDAAETNGIADSVKKRLKFDEHKLADVTKGIDQLIDLDDPIGQVLLKRELDSDLLLEKVACPIGVIGIIFEARPDALVQISTLCIKSGNCAVLKGGKETYNTNRALFDVIHDAAVSVGAPDSCMFLAENHSEIDELLACEKYVDLIIPRGSNAFVQYIMNNTRIPVMGHADGVCHTYIDEFADAEKAVKIIVDAKTQYTAACNATETLLVDEALSANTFGEILRALSAANVKIRGNKEVSKLIDCDLMGDDDYDTEYLDMVLSVKIVHGVDEAIEHINRFGSHHTDAIITESKETAERFMQLVDSAGVYWNASTRFADGFRYGFGAEVGISTGKIHARGPVGLDGLTTYKYKLYGNGNIVGEYADGTREFHFRDL